MRILEKNKDKINVYNYVPNYEKVVAYKKREIEKIPEQERVLIAETSAFPFEINKSKLTNSILRLNYSTTFETIYHKFEISKLSNEECKNILNKYIYNFEYDEQMIPHLIEPNYEDVNSVCKEKIGKLKLNFKDIEMLKTIKYFLAPKNYKHNYDDGIATMDEIINLPKTLFLFHLLINEQYKNIRKDYDISEQIELFSKEPQLIQSFDINKIKEFDDSLKQAGVNNEITNYQKLELQVESSEKILKILRKKY